MPLFRIDDHDDVMRETREQLWRPVRPISRPDILVQREFPNATPQPPNTAAGISTTAAGAPKHVLSVSATESPTKQQDRTFSLVTVEFTRDAADDKFAGVRVWLTGYKGNENAVLVVDGADSPISFLVESTNENVLVTVQAFGHDGSPASFAEAPTTTVLLDGVISASAAPTIAQSLTALPLGFQFSFNQLGGLAADVIDSYRIYRNTVDNSGTASLIQVIKHNPLNTGAVVFQDFPGSGLVRWYWVSAVNTAGLESSKAAAQSGAVTANTVAGASLGPTTAPNAPTFAAFTGNMGVFHVELNVPSGVASTDEPLLSYELELASDSGFNHWVCQNEFSSRKRPFLS